MIKLIKINVLNVSSEVCRSKRDASNSTHAYYFAYIVTQATFHIHVTDFKILVCGMLIYLNSEISNNTWIRPKMHAHLCPQTIRQIIGYTDFNKTKDNPDFSTWLPIALYILCSGILKSLAVENKHGSFINWCSITYIYMYSHTCTKYRHHKFTISTLNTTLYFVH